MRQALVAFDLNCSMAQRLQDREYIYIHRNVQEQVDIIRANYAVTGNTENVQQDIEDGPHHLDTRYLQDIAAWLAE